MSDNLCQPCDIYDLGSACLQYELGEEIEDEIMKPRNRKRLTYRTRSFRDNTTMVQINCSTTTQTVSEKGVLASTVSQTQSTSTLPTERASKGSLCKLETEQRRSSEPNLHHNRQTRVKRRHTEPISSKHVDSCVFEGVANIISNVLRHPRIKTFKNKICYSSIEQSSASEGDLNKTNVIWNGKRNRKCVKVRSCMTYQHVVMLLFLAIVYFFDVSLN